MDFRGLKGQHASGTKILWWVNKRERIVSGQHCFLSSKAAVGVAAEPSNPEHAGTH
jgi:hypothetical protein